jgi:uncharacterized protein YdhG (YjbR/CyaY superfamily)
MAARKKATRTAGGPATASRPARKRPTTIAGYIDAAPAAGQPHLRQLYALLKEVAPDAQEAIKWGTPFFIQPRFLFAFSAFKAHLSFAPMAAGLEAFREELADHDVTKNMLRVRYDEPLPVGLIRKIAKRCLREVGARDGKGFW